MNFGMNTQYYCMITGALKYFVVIIECSEMSKHTKKTLFKL